MAFWVAVVSLSELSSSSGTTAFVNESDKPPMEETKTDGSAAILLASAVMAGPAVPNALTTFAAKASPPWNVGGGRTFRTAAVLVSEAPSARNTVTSLLIAAVGSDAAVVLSELSDPDAVTIGASPLQKAVNHTLLWASSAPEESPTVVTGAEPVADVVGDPLLDCWLLAADEAGALDAAAVDAAAVDALDVLRDEALEAATADEAALLAATAVPPAVELQLAMSSAAPVRAATRLLVRFINSPSTDAMAASSSPTCVSALGPGSSPPATKRYRRSDTEVVRAQANKPRGCRAGFCNSQVAVRDKTRQRGTENAERATSTSSAEAARSAVRISPAAPTHAAWKRRWHPR